MSIREMTASNPGLSADNVLSIRSGQWLCNTVRSQICLADRLLHSYLARPKWFKSLFKLPAVKSPKLCIISPLCKKLSNWWTPPSKCKSCGKCSQVVMPSWLGPALSHGQITHTANVYCVYLFDPIQSSSCICIHTHHLIPSISHT